jgi:hypothetical protein
MKLIETKTLGTAVAFIEFTSIPQTFTDLAILISARSAAASPATDYLVAFNSDTTASNYAWRRMTANGGPAVTTDTSTSYRLLGIAQGNTATANNFDNLATYIPNYTSSSIKTYSTDSVTENNSTTQNTFFLQFVAGRWSGTSPITSIRVDVGGSTNLLTGSTFSLFGILKGSSGGVVVS